jgi:hypothetical protein
MNGEIGGVGEPEVGEYNGRQESPRSLSIQLMDCSGQAIYFSYGVHPIPIPGATSTFEFDIRRFQVSKKINKTSC